MMMMMTMGLESKRVTACGDQYEGEWERKGY
jgi:hypothetical protein